MLVSSRFDIFSTFTVRTQGHVETTKKWWLRWDTIVRVRGPYSQDFGQDFVNILFVICASKNGAKSNAMTRHHRFGRCLWTIACTHALAGEPTPPTWKNRGHRGIERTNAAAGGQWGKKVRTAFEPAGPSSLIAALLLPLPSTVPGLTRTRMQKWTIVDIKPLLLALRS